MMNKKRTGRFIALALLLAGLCSTAQAATKTWGGGFDTNFNNGANWSSAFVAGDVMSFTNTAPTGTNLYNDLTAGTSVGGFMFQTNALAYTIRGNSIALNGGITNNSTSLQTINLNMSLATTQTIGAGNITLGGVLSGAGGITRGNAAGIVTLSGSNTYTGISTFQKGTIVVSSLNSVVGGTASSSLGAPTTVANGTIYLGTGAQAAALKYTGAGETSDRVIAMASTSGNQAIDHQGTGYLKLTGGVTATGAGSKNLVLRGATGTTGEIAGVIANYDATRKTGVQFEGTGVWILSGTNTFSGDVTMIAGTNPGWLQVAKDENLGTGTNINLAQNNSFRTTGSFGTSKTITLAASGANQDIYAGSGTTLTLNGKVTGGAGATMRITGPGTVVYAAANDHGAGTTVSGNLKLTGVGTINNGSGKVSMNSGAVDLGGTAQTVGGLVSIGGNSFVSNGNLTVTSIVNSNFAGGVLTLNANLHGAGATLNQYQGTTILNGINDFTGATAVNSTGTLSKLVINGSTLSDITVSSGGTLGGSGTVHAVTMQAGSTLAAGNSPGTMTFTANASLEAGSTNIMEIYSSSLYDVLKGSSSNTLMLAGINEIDFTGWTTPGVTNGTTFNLFQNWSSVNTNGATFTFVNLANLGLAGGQTLEATGTGFTVIPEPATIGMLGLGALITLMLRRIRHG